MKIKSSVIKYKLFNIIIFYIFDNENYLIFILTIINIEIFDL